MNKKQSILIVEDDQNVLDATASILESAGYATHKASTGTKSLELIERLHPDLVLLDVNLPDIHGFDICKSIKSNPTYSKMLVIFVSGSRTASEHQIEGLESGADGYILRPISNRELIAKVNAFSRIQRVEEQFREKEAQYRFLAENASDMISRHSSTGTFIFASNACLTMFGYAPEELVGKNLCDFCHPDDENNIREMHFLILDRDDSQTNQYRFLRKNSDYIWVETTEKKIKDRDSVKVPEIIAVTRDISLRKHKEATLERKLNEEIRRKVEAVRAGNVGLWEWDLTTNKVYFSSEWINQIGHKEFEISDEYEEWRRRIHPEDLEAALKYINTLVAEVRQNDKVEFRFRHKNGAYIWILSQASAIADKTGKTIRVLGSHLDITEHKKAEEELKSEKHLSDKYINSLPGLFYVFDERRFVRWNKKWGEVTGFSDEELAGKYGTDFFEGEDKAYIGKQMLKVFQEGAAEAEAKLVTKDKQKIPYYFTGSRTSVNGKNQLIGLGIDITDRKRAEEDRERLMSAIEQAAEIIVITDADGNIQYTNPAFEHITGYTRNEAIGKNPRFLKSGEHGDAFYKEMWETLTSGGTWSGRMINKKKDGSLFTEETVISPVRNALGDTVNYVAVKRDITNEIKLEEQLRQAQKMESVGRLAGGVAHDFNNMLSVILGNTGMILNEIDRSVPFHDDLKEIQKAANRSADLTRQLLAFARKQEVLPKVLNLNEAVEGMLKMLQRLIGEDIDLIWKPKAELWTIKIDPGQIDQILANLCVNARDAIAGNGRIIIETDNTRMDEMSCTEHTDCNPGEYVLLSVSDNGCGIDKNALTHIFDPFFTTKSVGEGTGLGLAMIYGIVKQNRGTINIYSEQHHGTTFKIYLPRYAGKSNIPHDASPRRTAVGQETVLFVEDEPSLLKIGIRMLEEWGYRVMGANTPTMAIELAEKHSGIIHLLVTDVIMPEMNGRVLAERLLQLYPNIKKLFMSGYTADVISHHGLLEENVNFIQKPFSMEDLGIKVREILDED